MNRELKFRCWDKELTKWCYGHNQSILDDHNLTISFDGRLINTFGGGTNQDRFIIQQYTGIKDNNNKEVYEGDIVRLIGGTRGGVVEYNHISFGMNIMGYILPLINCDFEVVGNIFENGDLLK